MTSLTLNHIDKKYGSHTVLQFDQWKINTGVYWLKGGNGTGKTTLFRIISGQTPFKGQVLLDGIDLDKNPISFRAKISYAEAEPQYPLFITGRELLGFYKDVRQAKQDEINELAAIFDLSDFLDQKIGGYSSGMLKKLSLICAFIGNVDLYILDEPLITIDVASADKLYELILKKTKEGKSFLLSSHQEINSEKLNVDAVFEIKNKQLIKC
ncbi:ATP-binding cassette domain-containing protein [Pedobacter sp. UC225_65]|uniref:ATP-binding cassette domain-containing protein n=1 Tax=Pedobacter sp. UC225_65 TaxID=3350173 RepID=UPI00366B57AF